MEKFIILISGLPGAGKTTFSERLSERLGVPCANKDHIKEIMAETVGYRDRDENRKQSETAFCILSYFARKNMILGKPIILESNFRTDEGERLKALIDEYNYFPVTVFFEADAEILYQRYIKRIETGNRHFAHTSWVPNSSEDFRLSVEPLRSFNPGGMKITVNTDDFHELSYDNIFDEIMGIIKSAEGLS